MKPAKWWAWAAVLAAVCLGFGLRLTTRTQLQDGTRVRPLSSDDNYHMRRVRFAVAHYPRTVLFDRLMNYPAGGVPIWPPLYDVILATPSLLLHGPAASPAAIEREAAWVPPVMAAATIAIAGAIGAELFGSAGAILLALFLAVSPAHIMWTQYGHTDQHVAESLFGSLALLLYLRSRDPASRRPALREAAAGLGLAVAVLAWQGAIYWGAIFALALVLEAWRTRESVLRPAVLVLGVPAALTAAATALWLGSFRPPFTYVSFGYFQPLFLGSLAAGTVLLETSLRAARRQLARDETLRRGIALAIGAAALLPFAVPLLMGLVRGLGYVVGTTSEVAGGSGYVSYPRDWLKGIFEARPLFDDGPALAWRQLSAAFFLSPLAILLWARRAVRGDRVGFHAALAVWGTVTLVLAVAQRLNVYYAALLAAATVAEAARFVSRRFGETPLPRLAAGAAAALVLALPMVDGLAGELRSSRAAGADLFATLDWMRALPHEENAYDARFLDPRAPAPLSRASAVLAPWSLGHMILYEAELPVVANNFGYGFLDSIRFFLADSEAEALTIARERRVRWVVATDLVPRMNDYAGYLGKAPVLDSTSSGPAPTLRYFATMQSRLYDFDGSGARLPGASIAPLVSFRLRFQSRTAIPRGNRWIARWKVFEIVEPGSPEASAPRPAASAPRP